MPQLVDLEYVIYVDGDDFPLQESLTVGRHLDNDVVVAGEDILDFHLRLEPTTRGPRVIPLGEATAILNGADRAEPTGLISGDVLQVGQYEISFGVLTRHRQQAEEWWLHADGDDAQYKVVGELHVGRADNNEIMLIDDHISRHHASFILADSVVWLRDMGSANGTFVNGQRLSGGCRLFHGDQVAFDMLGFQLVGKGDDLTGVRRASTDESDKVAPTPLQLASGATADTTEVAVVEELPEPEIPESAETGAFLLGASDPVSGMTYRTRIGRTVLGRDHSCDVMIADSTVSARHAEIVTRPGSATITNLLATNGTRVNGQAVQSSDLKDGDLVQIGRVHLVYKDVPLAVANRPWLQQTQWLILGGSLILAVLLALLLV
jgi:pSer/pThr/pTyr-binding forkhead associated (FHA) protein